MNLIDSTSEMIIATQCKLLSITETARLLGVGKDTVYALLRTGQLGFIEIGKRKKISLIEMQNFILKNTKYRNDTVNNLHLDNKQIETILFPSNKRKLKSIDGGKILERIMRSE